MRSVTSYLASLGRFGLIVCYAAMVIASLQAVPVHADVTVDPDGVGATNVVQRPFDNPDVLTNPLPDPLDLGTDDFAVGDTADGALAIENGGAVFNGYGYIAYDSGVTGEVLVDGPGSRWDNSEPLTVGYLGTGTLTIQNGATVTSTITDTSEFGFSVIGSESGSIGTVTLDGADTEWVDDSFRLHVGNNGTGTLTIRNGATVTAGGTVLVNPELNGSQIQFEDGTITAQAVFASPDDLQGSGTITTRGWGFDTDLTLSQASDLQQQLIFNALPDQNVTVNINLSSGEGRLGVGYAGTASMTVQNGVTLTSSRGYVGYQSSSTGTATVDGAGSEWNISGDLLQVGFNGTGTLTIQNGGTVASSDTGSIGVESGSIGEVIVDGSGSIWENGSALLVGSVGTGTLMIRNGGAVSAGGTVIVNQNLTQSYIAFDDGALTAEGVVARPQDLRGTGTIDTQGWVFDADLVIDDASDLQYNFVLDSLPDQSITVDVDLSSGMGDLGAGAEGMGTILIRNGMGVTSSTGWIGYGPEASGAVTVEGAASTWVNSERLYAGFNGEGTLIIQDGAHVANTFGYLGFDEQSSGAATVDGAGSTWASSEDLYVGANGSGELTINNGGTVTNVWGFVGFGENASGTVTVNGAGSTWNQSLHLLVGAFGTGELKIQEGAAVYNTRGYLGYGVDAGGTATVDGSGSLWEINEFLLVGFDGSGTLAIQDGGRVTVFGDTFVDFGPESEGTLVFGIGADGAGSLETTGFLEIGESSTLRVTLHDGVVPTTGEQFVVATADGIEGTFANEPTPTLAGDHLLNWAVYYNVIDITLEVASSFLAADFDESGTVDGDDFLIWQQGFGESDGDALHEHGDADLNGFVNGNDFLVWQQQFGRDAGGGAVAVTPVPEPCTATLVSLLIALVLAGIGRRHMGIRTEI